MEWGFPYDANDQETPNNQLWGCIDTSVARYHCGGCANDCPTDELYPEDQTPTQCVDSVCDATLGSTCVAASEALDCNEICALQGDTCRANGCYGDTMFVFDENNFDCNSDFGTPEQLPLACDEPTPQEYGDAQGVRCCCE